MADSGVRARAMRDRPAGRTAAHKRGLRAADVADPRRRLLRHVHVVQVPHRRAGADRHRGWLAHGRMDALPALVHTWRRAGRAPPTAMERIERIGCDRRFRCLRAAWHIGRRASAAMRRGLRARRRSLAVVALATVRNVTMARCGRTVAAGGRRGRRRMPARPRHANDSARPLRAAACALRLCEPDVGHARVSEGA